MRPLKVAWHLLIVVLSFSLPAHAYFQMDFLKNKNSVKTLSQWTLADWLRQKNKSRLADQWLARNRTAGSLVEINLSGSLNHYKVKADDASSSVSHDSQSYQLDTYLSFFNLMGEYEKTDDDFESYGGAVGLRLLGTSSQTTNLVVRYGLRQLNDLDSGEQWKNQFVEGQLQLYVVSAFGLLGKYRHYFPHDSNRNNSLVGHRATFGAFLELGLLRFFVNYYEEPTESTSPTGATSKQKSTGYEYGLKLCF